LNLVRLRYLQFALKTQCLFHFFYVIETLHSILSELYYRLLNELIQERKRFLSVPLLIIPTILQFGRSSLLSVICEGKVILFMRNVLVTLQFKLLFLQLSYRFVIIAILISIFEITLTIVMIWLILWRVSSDSQIRYYIVAVKVAEGFRGSRLSQKLLIWSP
jgi:hypothetical protein